MAETMKDLITENAKAFEEFKDENDARLAALEKGKVSVATEIDQKLEKINKFMDESTKRKRELEVERQIASELKERVEILEAARTNPHLSPAQKVKDEYRAAFDGYIRSGGQSPHHEQKMMEIARKDVTIGSTSGGGYAVPEEISRNIELLELKFSPVRSDVKVVQTMTSDYKELVDLQGATAGWISEAGSRTATNTSTLREVVPTNGELYAYPQASEWSLDDIFFNVENWLADSVARAFAVTEATAVLTGNGSNKPTGMLNSAPTAVTDEAGTRAAAVYQYILGGDNSPAGLDGDALIDLVYNTNSAYRANGKFIMNSLSAGSARKIKDATTGAYTWQPGLSQGQPDRLLGYPVSIWEQMSDPNGGALPVAFGDLSRAYVIADRVGLRITRDNVTNVGYVRFYIRKRTGGIVLNNNAIKWLKLL